MDLNRTKRRLPWNLVHFEHSGGLRLPNVAHDDER